MARALVAISCWFAPLLDASACLGCLDAWLVARRRWRTRAAGLSSGVGLPLRGTWAAMEFGG
eukprot:11756527-Alexandrium_andersonii.AAC.1